MQGWLVSAVTPQASLLGCPGPVQAVMGIRPSMQAYSDSIAWNVTPWKTGLPAIAARIRGSQMRVVEASIMAALPVATVTCKHYTRQPAQNATMEILRMGEAMAEGMAISLP